MTYISKTMTILHRDVLKIASFILISLLLYGCGGGLKEPCIDHLNSPTPIFRIRAAKWAGDNKNTEAVGPLVNLLKDEDRSVRLYSIEALKRITGNDFGYKVQDAPAKRAKAIAKWDKYIADKYPGAEKKVNDDDK